jgi:N-methylhydantoinase A/oxoprolinase/acetone carboxylase beta subunit
VRVGVDVGGTNTDAALLDVRRVVAKAKRPTTPDVTSGIADALAAILPFATPPPAPGSGSASPGSAVRAVMIGTTHFTNAVVQRTDLAPVAVIRLGLPATSALPPLVDWPDDLRQVVGRCRFLAHGGSEFDGRALSPLDETELRTIAAEIEREGIRQAAISAVFSPVRPDMERQAAELLAGLVDGLEITCSADIGRIGLLPRESAAVLNASLRPLARRTIDGFEAATGALGLAAPVYLTQNDGTLMAAEFARRFPVFTFASGPTNSMRGAAFLSGLADAIVVDVGGTTTDVGELVRGFPREAALQVEVAGVRTNFRMPDIVSIGLGGGSLVQAGALDVGPRSVGYELTRRALVFGGDELTATDLVVAAGGADIGDRGRVVHLSPGLVERGLALIQARIAGAVDRVRSRRDPLPLIAVGGGSILLRGDVLGCGPTVRPPHHDVANAVGAAIAQVSGEVDRVASLERRGREAAVAEVREEAIARAIAAGADPSSVEVVEVEDVPLSYLPGNATRIRVKAVGELPTA